MNGRAEKRGRLIQILFAPFLGGLAIGALLEFGILRGGRHSGQQIVSFYGKHQAGIATPAQDFVFFAAFDLTTSSRDDLRVLLREWTAVAARLSSGRGGAAAAAAPLSPPADTGETLGYAPARLTVTFGAGLSLFDARFSLADRRPPALVDIPHFPGERLLPELSNGDLGVQICADDLQVAFHALRQLVRVARGKAVLRWSQQGFRPTMTANRANKTARNLQGFKDGTVNIDTANAGSMNQEVWAQTGEGADWMAGGSYLVLRRIRMLIEVWDRSPLQDQQRTIGREKENGAPLGAQKESDALDLSAQQGRESAIPDDAHVRLAHGDGSQRILRRPYSFVNGIDPRTGELDAGLLYISFQRDPRAQFIPIQQRLAATDALNEYITHVGSAIFACFPGAKEGGYVGDTLLQ